MVSITRGKVRRRTWVGLVLLVVVVVACLALAGAWVLSGSSPDKGPVTDPTPPSGHRWCKSLASVRPFATVVNQGVVGGRAFPIDKVGILSAVEAGAGTPAQVDADFNLLLNALSSGNNTALNQTRIAATQIEPVRAAAARLDLYCAV